MSGFNYRSYLKFDETWKDNPYYDCVVKFLLQPNDDLLDFHRRIHNCRIKVNRIVYKLVKKNQLPKQYSDLLQVPAIIKLMEQYNFVLSDHRRGIAYSCYDPYKAYMDRNEGIPQRPVNLGEWKALRFKETKTFITDLNPQNQIGTLEIITGGKGDTAITTTTPYSIPKGMLPSKSFIKPSSGGNIVPPKNMQNKKHWVYGARATRHFKWSYQPDDALGFDIGKRPDVFIAFSNGDIYERNVDINTILQLIKELNDLISNKDKTNTTSKVRKQHRLDWKQAQKELKRAMKPYVNIIIDKLDGKLLCIDDLTSGATNGEFGQVITKLLIDELHKLKLPYILVPTPHTSQRCSACGYTDTKNRPKQDEHFLCRQCKYKAHADVNAAINIKVFGKYIWDFGIKKFWNDKKDGMTKKYLFVDQIKDVDAEYSSNKTTSTLCSCF